MNIEGTYTLQASPEDVRNCLADAQTLQHTIPGMERLEALGEQRYAITLDIGYGPLAGRYQGEVTVIEREHPYHFHLVFEGEGRQTTISSDWTIELEGHTQYTVIAYKAGVSLGKPGIHLPAHLVKGAIKLLTQKFFTSLADQLLTIPTHIAVNEDDSGLFEAEQAEPPIIVSTPAAQPTLAHTIVQLLRLGVGDAKAEEQWVRRVRRLGITSILLLLVWIGTRLPRK
jgi:carbon monoxide dehydrogenase subunit G